MLPILGLRQFVDRIRHPQTAVVVSDENRSPVYVQYKHDWKGRTEPRRKHKVVALCVHQTAVVFGVSRSQVEAAKGDRRAALHKRFEKTPYHVVGLNCGDILLNNNPERYTYHGYVLNADSVGVAVEANHPRFARDYDEEKHSRWDRIAIEAARDAVREAHREATAWGASITDLWTHSQGKKNRAADPGELIFRDVMVPMAAELGLRIPTNFTRGSGQPLPREWTRHIGNRH